MSEERPLIAIAKLDEADTTFKGEEGEVVPIPTLPLESIRMRSFCEPVLNRIASEVPTPDVDSNVSVDDTAVPPMTSGVVIDVVIVGEADQTGAVLTPPDTKMLPVATSARRDSAVVVEA